MKLSTRLARVFRQVALAMLPALAIPGALAAEVAVVGTRQHEVIASTDWNDAQEVVIALGDHRYEPEEFTLKLGQPYRIVLRNVGAVSHDMVGGSFFDGSVIALRMVSSSAGRVVADYINSVYVRTKQDIELWLVPLQEGAYSFFCSLPGHRDDGMEGTVRIVR